MYTPPLLIVISNPRELLFFLLCGSDSQLGLEYFIEFLFSVDHWFFTSIMNSFKTKRTKTRVKKEMGKNDKFYAQLRRLLESSWELRGNWKTKMRWREKEQLNWLQWKKLKKAKRRKTRTWDCSKLFTQHHQEGSNSIFVCCWFRTNCLDLVPHFIVIFGSLILVYSLSRVLCVVVLVVH